MDLRTLDDSLTVSPQIMLEDIPRLAALGYRTLISNRPDGESTDQPDAASIARVAAAHGLSFLHIPVIGGSISDAQVQAFTDALHNEAAPLHAFCRSGTRSATLWALANPEATSVELRLSAAKAAGFDLDALRGRMENCSVAPTRGSRSKLDMATAASSIKRRPH